ncbi:TrbL/VirB6 plasmid conjugal transfer protein [Paraburkholderia sp. BL23I1N1]|uniref:type IV secretion system protein n=1 Tax=unclassified Paraburkholderia TaxID=2615204 RepID=UPI000AC48DE5|nr:MULTISPECIES: type IV secretion system protein [unclassified Paraburkholderia]REE18625.1 TrbL/VirB6 plasmid conjugal transfer protein [Paraburkholderia sp. BL27I4N3]RKE35639.1 TrbL/VirB6 plasmid conjugal transfer protein [Paraburkholderia sp. BL23I1N1]TCK94704.1 TrbL/VirB6 plasmid conjugal transfer protein [Paraburkholderia sp. BL9I2N2]
MNDVISVLNILFATMQTKGGSLQTLFLSDGLDLLAALGLIIATWHVFLWLLEGDFPGFFANLFRHLIRCAVILVLLTAWSTTVHSYFVDNMQTMASRVSGGDGNPGDLLRALVNAASTIMQGVRTEAAQVCEEVPDVTPEGVVIPNTEHQECGATSDAGANSAGVSSIWTLVRNLPLILLAFLAKALAIIAITLMTLIFVVVVQFGSFLLDIAFCLGPVLIPWYVLPAGEFLFDGWLRFTISAGLFKVVAWLMMAIVYSGVLPGIQSLVQQTAMQSGTNSDAYYATNYLAMLALALVCGVGAFMMWQVPDIAKSLVSGGAGGGLRGFGKGVMGNKLTPNVLK